MKTNLSDLKVGNYVSVKQNCRELERNYILRPYKYIYKGSKIYLGILCAKITIVDYNNRPTIYKYIVPINKIYKLD